MSKKATATNNTPNTEAVGDAGNKAQIEANERATQAFIDGLALFADNFRYVCDRTGQSLLVQTYYNIEKRLATLHNPTKRERVTGQDGRPRYVEVRNEMSVPVLTAKFHEAKAAFGAKKGSLQDVENYAEMVHAAKSEISFLLNQREILACFLDDRYGFAVKPWTHGEERKDLDSQKEVPSEEVAQRLAALDRMVG